MPPDLRKEISTVWLIPLSLIGLPFLVASVGRLLGAIGAGDVGEMLVGLARSYGNLPIFLLGFSPSPIEDTMLVYVVAGLVYSGVLFLLVVAGGFVLRRARRS